MSFNVMAVVTVNNNLGHQENKMSMFPFFHHVFAMKFWNWMP